MLRIPNKRTNTQVEISVPVCVCIVYLPKTSATNLELFNYYVWHFFKSHALRKNKTENNLFFTCSFWKKAQRKMRPTSTLVKTEQNRKAESERRSTCNTASARERGVERGSEKECEGEKVKGRGRSAAHKCNAAQSCHISARLWIHTHTCTYGTGFWF